MTEGAEEAGRQCARAWLEALLKRAERGAAAGSTRAIATTQAMLRDYKKSGDVDFHRGVRDFLNNDRAREAVELVWEPYYEGHDLKKIRLKDVGKLRELLGTRSLADVAEKAIQDVRVACLRTGGVLNPQLTALLDDMGGAWRRGRPCHGLRAEAPEEAAIVFKTVAAILEGENHGLDMRTFSVKVHGNSKIVENNRRATERLLQTLYPPIDGREFDLLTYLGLEKTPQPFFIGGQHRIRLKDGNLLLVQDYLGFPRSRIAEATIESTVAGFLIVENWTTYAKAACVAPSQWLVLFCSGFPSPAWIEVTRGLLDLRPNVPALHWGDVDLGGFRIFEHLHSHLSNRLQPYWMSPAAYAPDAPGREPTDSDLRELRRIASRIPALQQSTTEIECTKRFGLEQEAILLPAGWIPTSDSAGALATPQSTN